MASTKSINKKSKVQLDSFEHSIKRLEQIVENLEQGSIPLEDSIRMYEEGVKISKDCLKRLHDAELKIKRLTKDINGNFELSDEQSVE
jgi:exodeoxyribonuclease VII small subunit